MDAASPGKPMLTVALDVPSAYILADQAAIIQDLQFVMDGCKRLLAELAKTQHPMSCPHGRPVVLRYTMTEIQRAFKRI